MSENSKTLPTYDTKSGIIYNNNLLSFYLFLKSPKNMTAHQVAITNLIQNTEKCTKIITVIIIKSNAHIDEKI